MDKFVIFLTTLLLLYVKSNCGENNDNPIIFSYDPDSKYGPLNWKNVYQDCGRKRQSPIDVEVSRLNRGLFTTQLQLKGLNSSIKSVEVRNHALTVNYKFEWDNYQPYLSGGPLSGTYLLESIHFHWGIVHSDGSEHAINGHRYAMEGHFVFYNKAYSSAKAALNHADGFAVIGVLFEMNSLTPDLEFLKLANAVPKKGDSVTLQAPVLKLRELVPNNFTYAYYKGSFTTPPCYQIVDWFVSMEVQTVNHIQLRALRQLHDEHIRPLAPNNRPLQMTHGRRVLLGLIDNE